MLGMNWMKSWMDKIVIKYQFNQYFFTTMFISSKKKKNKINNQKINK